MLSISKALQNWKEASILQVLQGCMAESTLAQHLWGGEGLCVQLKDGALGPRRCRHAGGTGGG